MATSSQTNLVQVEEDNIKTEGIPHKAMDITSTPNFETGEHDGFKMYKRRWIGMLAIISLNLSTGLVWLTFNAVSNISVKWLNASLSEVNLSVILYFIGSIVMSSVSGFVFEKWGVKRGLIIGGILNVTGTWIRYFGSFIESSEDAYMARLAVVLIGQFIAAMAQPFFLNAPPKFSAVWFNDKSRTTATTIGSISNPLGAAVSMLLVPAICSNPEGDDMPLTLLVIAVLALVALIPGVLMPPYPPTPPSASAKIALEESKDESFLLALKKVSSNLQFWILLSSFSVFCGFFNAVSSLTNQIVVPYNYTDDDSGVFGICLIISGIIGAGIFGVYVDKTKQYILLLRLATPFLALGYIAFVFVVQENNFVLICCVCVLIGFCSFGLLPVALELGVECTYPNPPSTSTSVLWMGGQALGVIFLVAGDSIRDSSPFSDEPKDTMRTGLICVAVVCAITAVTTFAFNSPYHRLEAEKAKNDSNDVAVSSEEQLS